MADSESEDDESKQAGAINIAADSADIDTADKEAANTTEEVKEVEEKVETATKKEELPDDKPGGGKPSYTLHIRGLTSGVDLDELKVRLERFGEVVDLQQEDGTVVAKFSKTSEAYEAQQKLTLGPDVLIEFGPQDADHYNRAKKRGRRQDTEDGTGAGNNKGRGLRAFQSEKDEGLIPKKKTEDEAVEAAPAKKARGQQPDAVSKLTPPSKPISRWSDRLSFEEQLEDFMKMPRRGMYNRYLVLGKLPPELRTGENIWRLMQPVQKDIVQVEMLTCFGKPVAHVTLRSATAAAAMHRLCEQNHKNLTVAFAPPRKATTTLWLGNVDDFVPRKSLESVLASYGKVLHGLRYLPARTCAFATFGEVSSSIAARNSLYGLEVQKNQYLNIDFVDDVDAQAAPPDAWGMWGGGAPAWPPPPWGMPGMPPWGHRPPWAPPPGIAWGMPGGPGMPPMHAGPNWRPPRDSDHWRNSDAVPGARLVERSKKGRARQDSASRSPREGKKKDKEGSKGDEPDQRNTKFKVKLYKMGEFCCNIVANFVKGKESPESLTNKLQIDQRTKIDHCRAHMERAGALSTVWHFSAADRRDCAAYDALCDYFVEKQRVGLVQTPSYYIYIVPPTEKYLKELSLPASNFVVGLQIPIKK